MKLNIPNIITLSRIIVTPIFFFMFLSDNGMVSALSCVLFLVAALSDYFDGWYARKYNQTSSWGEFIDPLADKILIGSAFVAMASLDIIPWYMVWLIIARDIITTLLRQIAIKKQLIMKTSQSAKYKTAAQFVFIACIHLLIFARGTGFFDIPSNALNELIYSVFTQWAMLAVTLFTVYTLVEYVFKNKSIFK